MFLLFVNDITEGITSPIRLFADDCLIYREIDSPAAQHQLQQDLDRLQAWADKWLMEFNVKKCFAMQISLARKKLLFRYTMQGQQLETTPTNTYLGVTLHQKMSWAPHIEQMTAKANRVLGFIRRNLKGTPPSIKSKAYTTVVRPTLEYASVIWDPAQAYLVDNIERVQNRAARFTLNKPHYDPMYREASVTEMKKELGWPTLQQRRKQSKVTFMYKIEHDLVAIPSNLHPTPADERVRLRCPHRLHQPTSRVGVHSNSFLVSTIKLVNEVPHNIYGAPSLDAMKSGLASFTFNLE